MKPTLLIAESDAELCEIYEKFLTQRGYDVETAATGLECLAKLRRMRPAALVLASGLPWGGSDGVLQWAREERPSGLPIVLTATAGAADFVRPAMAPPVFQFLAKPFGLTALLDAITSAIEDARTELVRSHRGSHAHRLSHEAAG